MVRGGNYARPPRLHKEERKWGEAMLSKVKTVLGITVNDYDTEIMDLIEAAKADLGIAGITENENLSDPLIIRAVNTYVKANFRSPAPEEYDRLLASYETQKKQMMSATGYTDWRGDR